MISDALAIARYHIMLVGMSATLVFGWLMTGRYYWGLAAVVGVDWFLINLMNRITDIDEDLKNKIPGTERVQHRRALLTYVSFAIMFGSFAITHMLWPALTPYRLAVQIIGLAYNYNLVPTTRGLSRLKEIYFFKNFGSSLIFTFTGFLYPLAMPGAVRAMPWLGIVALILFFILFEMTFEIIYDLRDLEGDRAESVPTFPVVHGVVRARQIIDSLLVASSIALLLAFSSRNIGVRELLMIAAPVAQFAFYRARWQKGFTSGDCIVMTHTATALLLLYLGGTCVWQALDLPDNIFL